MPKMTSKTVKVEKRYPDFPSELTGAKTQRAANNSEEHAAPVPVSADAVSIPRSDADTLQQLGKLEVRSREGHLLCVYNPMTDCIEIKDRKTLHSVDVNKIRHAAKRNILVSEPGVNLQMIADVIGGEVDREQWVPAINDSIVTEEKQAENGPKSAKNGKKDVADLDTSG